MGLGATIRKLQDLSTAAERLQVELRGRYSAARLRDFVQYSQTTTLIRVVAVLALTAVPSTLSIIVVDLLPLQPPSLPLADQTATYWIREFFSSCFVTGASLVQWHHASPDLPLKFSRIAAATIINSVGTTVIMLVLHLLVGFPTPFLYQGVTIPWQSMLAISLSVLWKDAIRASPHVKQDLMRFSILWAAQVFMVILYPVLSFVFRRLSSQHQTIFSMVLPVCKIALKNVSRLGTDRLEDLTPVLIVFTVDVFHALFLASAMQSSSATGSSTLIVVMTIDFGQSCVAVMEVYLIRSRINRLETTILVDERGQIGHVAAVASPVSVVPSAVSAISPSAAYDRNTIERATNILVSSPKIRDHFTKPTNRQRRPTNTIHPLLGPSLSVTQASFAKSEVFLRGVIETPSSNIPVRQPQADSDPCHLEKNDAAKLEYVQANMKLMHMVEFYMLIEFTEVLIAIVYSIYLLAVARLPNRQFYLPLQHLTEEQLTTTVRYVMKYAALEMLSFVMLAIVFDRMLSISTMRQLAFTLQKHWVLVQSLLVLWVFFPTQMTLEHLGCDYTFKFAWLRKKHSHP